MKIIRVFPKRTAMTPTDDYAFVGDPPLIRPQADEVHVDCTFTWDKPKAERLAKAWGQYYEVKLGGCAYDDPCNGFTPEMYVHRGVIFTSRGCNNQCPWCLAWKREGKWRPLPIVEGNTVQDNNILQDIKHFDKVIEMLKTQRHIQFAGGLDARLITDYIAEQIRSLSIYQIFLAADTKQALKPLRKAIKKLALRRDKIRCYALLAFNGESISDAIERLETIWELGAIPFAQLYQPPGKLIEYSQEWRDLARTWSRPAATKALVRLERFKEGI